MARLVHLFGPSFRWKESGRLQVDEQKESLLLGALKSDESPDSFRITIQGWSIRGNPIVRVDPWDENLDFEISQSSLDDDQFYHRRPADFLDFESITASDPIQAAIFFSDEKPQIKIKNGHHRFFFGRRKNQRVYIEIDEVLVAPYRSGLSWGQIAYEAS